MERSILVINAGSSSIKFSFFSLPAKKPGPALLCKGQVEGLYSQPQFSAKETSDKKRASAAHPALEQGHHAALRFILDWLQPYLDQHCPIAIGHRVVHGGTRYTTPQKVTDEVLSELKKLEPLAPLHQQHNLIPIEIMARLLPDVPQVVCFDTAFHRTQPELAQLYALEYELAQREGIRRYGMHGLSYEYVISRLGEIDPKVAAGRVVVAHLGNGSSMAGIRGGRCCATTMGFTALEGLPMGTRCGTIDAAIVLYLYKHCKMDIQAIEDLLYKKSGLLGVSGISSDMRDLHAASSAQAKLAINMLTYRIAREALSLAVTTGGLDALVFTGGIGENDETVRADVARQLAWFGVDLDVQANRQRSADARCISTPKSKVTLYVIPTDEEWMIAKACVTLV